LQHRTSPEKWLRQGKQQFDKISRYRRQILDILTFLKATVYFAWQTVYLAEADRLFSRRHWSILLGVTVFLNGGDRLFAEGDRLFSGRRLSILRSDRLFTGDLKPVDHLFWWDRLGFILCWCKLDSKAELRKNYCRPTSRDGSAMLIIAGLFL
jgi:hypothetical protein